MLLRLIFVTLYRGIMGFSMKESEYTKRHVISNNVS